jgi:3-methyladenine DNA glycosylase/8-oxoguanine DNA glycosylase
VTILTLPAPIDLRRSLRPLVASAQDPTIRLRDDGVVRCQRTPDGPATIELRRVPTTGDEPATSAEAFAVRCWGPGADWAAAHAPDLLGASDDLTGFDPSPHRLVATAHRRRAGLRMVRTGRVEDLLVSTILAQRVTSREAARSWTRLVRAWGEPAPGPHGLRLPPAPDRLAATPYWAFHRMGVERDRAVKIVTACRRIDRLQQAVDLPQAEALARFCALPGLGVWTAALVLRAATGDPDLVEVGDFHVKHQIAWNLAGEPRATDERMLELLAPFAGHRGRVVRLVLSVGSRPPTYGPRVRVIPVDTL